MPPAPATPVATPGNVFVARQAILDRGGRVFGYELLHRTAGDGESFQASADQATAQILTDGLLAIGLDALTGGRKAFVNVSRQFLLDGIPAVLPAGRVVFEVDATTGVDPEVVAACEKLVAAGYALALDFGREPSALAGLLPYASFVKVDFSSVPAPAQWSAFLPDGMPSTVQTIATKVETAEQLTQAIAQGYTYYQGFYFGRPVVKEGSAIPPQQVAQLRLLAALNDPNLSVSRIEALIKPDPSICYRILRAVNSAGFALQATVHSIQQALVLLGRDTVRRWASLWAMATLGQGANAELLAMATVRARCCELLAMTTGRPDAGAEGFLMGLCSLLDSILQRPMRNVVSELPLPEEVESALLGVENPHRHLLDAAIAYEWGEWEQAAEHARLAGADPDALAQAYANALRWAYDLRRSQVIADDQGV